jgi:hypothetical protein
VHHVGVASSLYHLSLDPATSCGSPGMARLPHPSGVLLATQLLLALVTAQSLNTSNTAQGIFPSGPDQIQLSPPTGYPGASRDGIPRIDLVNLTSAAVTKLSVSRSTLSLFCHVSCLIVLALLTLPHSYRTIGNDRSPEFNISPLTVLRSTPKGIMSES